MYEYLNLMEHVLAGIELPAGEPTGELFETLLRRRTTRSFDPDASISLAQLDVVLRYVFGAHGYATTVADTVVVVSCAVSLHLHGEQMPCVEARRHSHQA